VREFEVLIGELLAVDGASTGAWKCEIHGIMSSAVASQKSGRGTKIFKND